MNPVAAKCVPICRAGCHQRSYGETGSDDVQCPRVVEYRAQREQGLALNPVVFQISSQMRKKSFRSQKQPEYIQRGTTETKKEQCQKWPRQGKRGKKSFAREKRKDGRHSKQVENQMAFGWSLRKSILSQLSEPQLLNTSMTFLKREW